MRVILFALLALSEALYATLLFIDPAIRMNVLMSFVAVLFAAFAACAYIIQRSEDRERLLPVIIVASVVFRLTLIPLGLPQAATMLVDMRDDLAGKTEQFRRNLFLDDDVWRYLWDGHVSAGGANPYRSAPANISETRSSRAAAVRLRVNHADLVTIYPPVAQAMFLAAHSMAAESIVAWKLLLVVAEMIVIGTIVMSLRRLKQPRSDVVLYALNPLVILMFAGAGHVDAIMVTLLSVAFWFLISGHRRAAGTTLGLAILAKLTPVVLIPVLARRLGRAGILALTATVGIVCGPFLLTSGGGLHTFSVFANTWDFNSASFALLRIAGGSLNTDPSRFARLVGAVVFISIAAWIWRRSFRDQSDLPGAAINTIAALLLLSPTMMPWYATWTLGLAPLARRPYLWIFFSAVVCLSFPMTIGWKTRPGWLLAEYGALMMGAAIWYFVRSSMNGRAGAIDCPARQGSAVQEP